MTVQELSDKVKYNSGIRDSLVSLSKIPDVEWQIDLEDSTEQRIYITTNSDVSDDKFRSLNSNLFVVPKVGLGFMPDDSVELNKFIEYTFNKFWNLRSRSI